MSNLAIATVVEKADLPAMFGTKENGKPAVETIITKIEDEARSIVFDIGTKDGQATCRSLAAKIASTKSALDKVGKAKKDEYTVTTKAIDADRRLIKERLQLLQDEIRKPLTELEEQEKARKANHEENIKGLSVATDGLNSTALNTAIASLESTVIGDEWEEYKTQALEAKDSELIRLRSLYADVKKHEQEQAELKRLREEQAERERLEREKRIADEAAENARKEAERKSKAEQAKAEQELQAIKQREAIAKAEKEAAELRAKQAAEQERKRIEDEQAMAQKLEAERKANTEHRNSIMFAAVSALVSVGLNKDDAKKAVRAIHDGKIPAVTIKY